MNLRQKLYDAQDSGNILMKINNSSALYKNLEKIQSRKPIYVRSSLNKRKNSNNKEYDYYLQQENKIFGKILLDINDREIKSRVNTEQNEILNKDRNSRRKYFEMQKRLIGKENRSFLNRVFNQKSIISPRKMDKDFNIMVNKFNTKKNANKKLILPPIH